MVETQTNLQLDIGSGREIASGVLDGIIDSFKRYAVAATRMTSAGSMALTVFLIFMVVGLRFWRMA